VYILRYTGALKLINYFLTFILVQKIVCTMIIENKIKHNTPPPNELSLGIRTLEEHI
jgi:hypothetical protein